jgi:hypothetical protein
MSELALGEIAPGDYTMQLGFEALKAVRVAAEGCTAACRAVHADVTLSEGARHKMSTFVHSTMSFTRRPSGAGPKASLSISII